MDTSKLLIMGVPLLVWLCIFTLLWNTDRRLKLIESQIKKDNK